MLTSIILGGAALLGLGVYTGYTKAEQQSKTQTSFNNYKQYLEDKGLSNISTKDMLGELYMTNKITVDEYKKAITNLSDLEKDIKTRSRGIFNPSQIKQDVETIKTLYKRLGNFKATVDAKTIKRKDNQYDIIFEITEGDKAYIKNIEINLP